MNTREDFDQAIDFVKSCSNPSYITAPDGHTMPVPCGKCKYCQLKKSYNNKRLCDIEANNHEYTYFATLTYSKEYVPYISLKPNKSFSFSALQSYSIYPCNRIAEHENFDIYPYFLPTDVFMSKEEFNDIISRVNSTNTQSNNRINVLYYHDIQNFLKRLRKNVSKFSNSQLRYYAVGEYGPEHYRPHWHVILYFNDKAISENIVQVVSKSWKYGYTNTSKSRGKVSHYLTSYVNSNAIIPNLYKTKPIRPRALHSKFFGLSILKPFEKEIIEKGLEFFDTKDFNISNKIVKLYPTKNIRDYYFPKISGFSQLSFDDKVDLYSFYLYTDYIKNFYGFNNLHELFTFYIDVIQSDSAVFLNMRKDTCHNFLRTLAIIYQLADSNRREYDNDYLFAKFLSVYYTSKRFCTLYKVNSLNVISFIRKIEKFYSDYDYKLLTDFYAQLENYSQFCKSADEQNSVLLFYNNGVNFLHGKATNPLKEFANISLESNFERTIKHKRINDLLNIFSVSY